MLWKTPQDHVEVEVIVVDMKWNETNHHHFASPDTRWHFWRLTILTSRPFLRYDWHWRSALHQGLQSGREPLNFVMFFMFLKGFFEQTGCMGQYQPNITGLSLTSPFQFLGVIMDVMAIFQHFRIQKSLPVFWAGDRQTSTRSAPRCPKSSSGCTMTSRSLTTRRLAERVKAFERLHLFKMSDDCKEGQSKYAKRKIILGYFGKGKACGFWTSCFSRCFGFWHPDLQCPSNHLESETGESEVLSETADCVRYRTPTLLRALGVRAT